ASGGDAISTPGKSELGKLASSGGIAFHGLAGEIHGLFEVQTLLKLARKPGPKRSRSFCGRALRTADPWNDVLFFGDPTKLLPHGADVPIAEQIAFLWRHPCQGGLRIRPKCNPTIKVGAAGLIGVRSALEELGGLGCRTSRGVVRDQFVEIIPQRPRELRRGWRPHPI